MKFFEKTSSRKEIDYKNYMLLKFLKQLIEEKKLQVFFLTSLKYKDEDYKYRDNME